MSKKYKPINSSSRGVVLIDRSSLWKGGPLKCLTERLRNTGGKNNMGRLTIGGRKANGQKIYRKIDFKRNKDNTTAIVQRIEYDPNRNAFIALIKYEDGQLSYILAPDKLKPGDEVVSGTLLDFKVGYCSILEKIPSGINVHNVEIVPGRGGKFARSAGSYVELAGKEGGFAILKMPSGESRKVSLKCRATIGQVSNIDALKTCLGKAGRAVKLGKRPIVRGIAKNPVDHPNGGRTNGGKIFSNHTGRVIKGKRTRAKKKTSGKMIISRRKSRRNS